MSLQEFPTQKIVQKNYNELYRKMEVLKENFKLLLENNLMEI